MISKLKFIFLLFLVSCGAAKMPSAYFSKEVCSCLFVEKQTAEYCKKYGSSKFPIWGSDIDLEKKEVYSQGYFRTSTAKFLEPRLGCQLVSK